MNAALISGTAFLVWLIITAYRVVVWVGDDMADSWKVGEVFTKDMFASALWEHVPKALAWPVLVPVKLVGTLLWRLCTAYGSRICEPPEPKYEPREELLITDELAKIPPRALAAGATPIASGSSETLAELVAQVRSANAETVAIPAVTDQTVALPTVDDVTAELPQVPYQARHA